MDSPAQRVTLADVARTAGVGVATVDRVLNGRAPVSPRTAQKVLAAAETLGYHAQGLMRRRLEDMAPARHFGFILQKEQKWFYRTLAAALEREAKSLSSLRASVEISFVSTLSPDALATEILRLAARCDALGVVAVDHAKVTRAIRRVSDTTRVFSLLSPLTAPDVLGFVGIDGRRAGRTAGWAMSRMVPKIGVVGILVGSHRYIGHETLEAGFRSYMRNFAPEVTLRDSVIYLDDRAVAYEAMTELLLTVTGLSGLYHVGGGATGAIRALEETGKGAQVTYVCHETTPVAVQALIDGTVDMIIETPIEDVARKVVGAMAQSLGPKPAPLELDPVAFRLVTPENC